VPLPGFSGGAQSEKARLKTEGRQDSRAGRIETHPPSVHSPEESKVPSPPPLPQKPPKRSDRSPLLLLLGMLLGGILIGGGILLVRGQGKSGGIDGSAGAAAPLGLAGGLADVRVDSAELRDNLTIIRSSLFREERVPRLPPEGMQWLVCKVTVTGRGPQPVTLRCDNFRLVAEDGAIYQSIEHDTPGIGTKHPDLGDYFLQPTWDTKPVVSSIAFQVKRGTQARSIEVSFAPF
jgi:hypothetical protein